MRKRLKWPNMCDSSRFGANSAHANIVYLHHIILHWRGSMQIIAYHRANISSRIYCCLLWFSPGLFSNYLPPSLSLSSVCLSFPSTFLSSGRAWKSLNRSSFVLLAYIMSKVQSTWSYGNHNQPTTNITTIEKFITFYSFDFYILVVLLLLFLHRHYIHFDIYWLFLFLFCISSSKFNFHDLLLLLLMLASNYWPYWIWLNVRTTEWNVNYKITQKSVHLAQENWMFTILFSSGISLNFHVISELLL